MLVIVCTLKACACTQDKAKTVIVIKKFEFENNNRH